MNEVCSCQKRGKTLQACTLRFGRLDIGVTIYTNWQVILTVEYSFLQRFRVYARNKHFIWENIPIQKQIKHFGRTLQHNFVTKVVHLIDSRI